MIEFTEEERKLLDAANQSGQISVRRGTIFVLGFFAALASLMVLSELLGLVWPRWSGGVRQPLDTTLTRLSVWVLLGVMSVMGYWFERFTVRVHSLIRKLHQELQESSRGVEP
jgi:hypothetical protein